MPLRSPKMYFCIFGFHRFVWWPKCTPASSSSFIVRFAMFTLSCSVGLRSRGARSTSRFPGITGDRISEPCVVGQVQLGRVLRVDSNVLLGEVGCPHPVLAAAEA